MLLPGSRFCDRIRRTERCTLCLIHCGQEISSNNHTNHTLPWPILVLHQLKVNGGELNFHVYENSV